MLKVECDSCKAPYQVDERRVPAAGLKMRCPKCGHSFLVTMPSSPGAGPAPPAPAVVQRAPPPPPAPGGPPPSRPQSSVGIGVPGFATAPPSISKKTMIGIAPSGAAPTGPTTAVGVPSSSAASEPLPSDFPAALGFLEEHDLPVISPDLPATKGPPPKPPVPTSKGLPAAPRPGERAPVVAPAGRPTESKKEPKGLDFDLPARVADLPARSADLPARAVDLPMAKPAAPARAPPTFEVDLPSTVAELPMPAAAGLPVVSAGLPIVSAGLPIVSAGLPIVSAGLPAPAASLPVAAAILPTVASALPVTAQVLPVAAQVLPDPAGRSFGEIDLPTITEALPTTSPREQHLPLPAHSPDLASPGAFGEIDLPRESIPGGPSRLSPPGRSSVDSVDLELNEGPRSASIRVRSSGPPGLPTRTTGSRAEGGMNFGEVEFGSGGEASGDANATIGVERSADPVWSPPGAAAAAAVPVAGRLPGERRRPALARRKQPVGKMLALALTVAFVLGGAALQLTPHGAFGYQDVSDLVHASAYASATAAAIHDTQIAMGTDTYDAAKGAVDKLFAAHVAMPRAKALTAYAALVEYETSLRFGPDTARASRGKQLLGDFQADAAAKYLDVALAGQAAEAGTADRARSLLGAASKRSPGDPIELDIARLQGDLELAARDGTAALGAFKHALDLSNDARAHFGLARAYELLGDSTNTKKEIDATLAASPTHAGALTLRARRATAVVDPVRALADIDAILEGPGRKASPNELSQAYAAKAWVNLERGRTNDAREAFGQAVKLNPSNVEALTGEGKLFMDDGRYAEALARFDTALQIDSTSPQAIANDAEAKLSLERLADAKQQLVAARDRYPKALAILLVLGKVEHHLGNNDAAESDLRAAIALVDPLRGDAVLPYVALSELMSARGRLSDARATLEEARKRLAPSSTLERALGEVSELLGDSEGAMAHFKTAVERDSRDLKAHFRLAIALRKARRLDAASAELDRVAAVDSQYPGLLLERGLLFEESGDIDKAIVEFKAALARAPEDPDLQLRVGAAYVVIGMPDDALPMLRKVLEKRTTSAEAHHYIGRAYMLRGGPSLADAVHYLKRAVELDPNRAEFHVYLARAANESTPAQLELARDEIDRALTIDKLNADAYWQRGVLERMEGAVDDAMKDEKHALQIRPSRYEAHATLAECYEDRNDGAQALAEWAQAIAGDGNASGPNGQVPHPYWRYRYGKLLMEGGKRPAALAQLLPAVTTAEKMDVRPGWLAPLEFLSAEALRSAGRKADSVEHYKRFLEIAPISSPDRLDAQRALEQLTGGR
jgi:predicted Zn finger-like uncharacterized protein